MRDREGDTAFLGPGALSSAADTPAVLVLREGDAGAELRYASELLVHVIGSLRGAALPLEVESGGDSSRLRIAQGIEVDHGLLLSIHEAASLHREMKSPHRDRHGRFDEQAISWDTDRPWISELAVNLCERAGWEIRKPFRVIVTHDIDRTTVWEPGSLLKAGLETVRPAGAWVNLGRLLPADSLERTVEELLEWERGEGIRSIFFFLADRYGTDTGSPHYELGWRSTRRILHAVLAAGMEIGLHGGYRVCCQGGYGLDAARLKRVIGRSVRFQRNHYLRFDPRKMGSALQQAGFTTDFSVGCAGRIGFRAGLAHEYPLYDHGFQRSVAVLEIPFIFMERLEYLQDAERTLAALGTVLDRVKRVRGTVAIIFHPENLFVNPAWFDMLRRTVELARARGALLDGMGG